MALYERIAVARPPDANAGSVRARALSERTVYRYLRDQVADEVVELAGWRATFATRPDAPPVRVSPWTRR